ncbi:MAG: TetR/AcrR family transcriptional regulator [Desulfovibrio sp.]|nr:MAG: TetR/AcrR family transcriptional regulator [Desulfovibrio sp.]
MTDSSGKDRRMEILEAARTCLARYGFDKLTMEDVGKEVGLNKASLYYYFKNKETLVSEVIGAEMGQSVAELQAKVESETGCEQRITTYLVERFRIYQRVSNLHNLSLGNFRQVGPTLRALYKDYKVQEIAFLATILDYCVAENAITDCDTTHLASAILSVADGFKLEVLNDPSLPPHAPVDYSIIEKEVVFTVSLMLKGMAGKGNVKG